MTDPALPTDRGYTDDHEWVLLAPGSAPPSEPVRVGITAVAVQALGELVFVELPPVGTALAAGDFCGEVESTKTVAELRSPVDGTVTAVNQAAVDDPGLITGDPYGAGWLFAILPTAADGLLTPAEYAAKNGLAP